MSGLGMGELSLTAGQSPQHSELGERPMSGYEKAQGRLSSPVSLGHGPLAQDSFLPLLHTLPKLEIHIHVSMLMRL